MKKLFDKTGPYIFQLRTGNSPFKNELLLPLFLHMHTISFRDFAKIIHHFAWVECTACIRKEKSCKFDFSIKIKEKEKEKRNHIFWCLFTHRPNQPLPPSLNRKRDLHGVLHQLKQWWRWLFCNLFKTTQTTLVHPVPPGENLSVPGLDLLEALTSQSQSLDSHLLTFGTGNNSGKHKNALTGNWGIQFCSGFLSLSYTPATLCKMVIGPTDSSVIIFPLKPM